MTRHTVPTYCHACGTHKPRGAFNSKADNSPQPNCRDCGNDRRRAIKTCTECKLPQPGTAFKNYWATRCIACMAKPVEKTCPRCGVKKVRADNFTKRRNGSYARSFHECQAKPEPQIPTPLPKVSAHPWFDLGASDRPRW